MTRKHALNFIVIILLALLCSCTKNPSAVATSPEGVVSVPNPSNKDAILSKHYIITGGVPVLDSYVQQYYNENGAIIKGNHYNANGTLAWYDIYGYSTTGNKTSYKNYNSSGSLNYINAYEYNTNGQLQKALNYDKLGNLTSYIIYENGNLINENLTFNNSNELESFNLSNSAKYDLA